MKISIIDTLCILAFLVGVANTGIYFKCPFLERLMHPGYGTCGKCNRPWAKVQQHSTSLDDESISITLNGEPASISVGHGVFPLCEACWQELGTPLKRMPYYRALWEEWHTDRMPWARMEKAVIDEKQGTVEYIRIGVTKI